MSRRDACRQCFSALVPIPGKPGSYYRDRDECRAIKCKHAPLFPVPPEVKEAREIARQEAKT
jgi:hypothetical protein